MKNQDNPNIIYCKYVDFKLKVCHHCLHVSGKPKCIPVQFLICHMKPIMYWSVKKFQNDFVSNLCIH